MVLIDRQAELEDRHLLISFAGTNLAHKMSLLVVEILQLQ